MSDRAGAEMQMLGSKFTMWKVHFIVLIKGACSRGQFQFLYSVSHNEHFVI